MKIDFKKTCFLAALAGILILSCKKKSAGPPAAGGTILDKEVYYDSISGSVSTLYFTYNADGDLTVIASALHPMSGDSLAYLSPGHLLSYKAGSVWGTRMIYDSNGVIVKKVNLYPPENLEAT